MNALEEKIKLLEQVIELQKQLLAQKAMSYPVYIPYPSLPLYDPWKPWKPYYYEQQPHTICTTTAGELKWIDNNTVGSH